MSAQCEEPLSVGRNLVDGPAAGLTYC